MSAPNADDVRRQLAARRHELLTRLGRIGVDMRRELDPISADFAEQAVQRENDEVLQSIAAASEAELRQIDAALRRLAEGRYGVCAICAAPIEPDRLAAIPYATRCGACADK